MRKWWKYFQYSNIDFIHTSHGNSFANSLFVEHESDSLTWSFMAQLTQKRIIADASFGFGGGIESENKLFFSYLSRNHLKVSTIIFFCPISLSVKTKSIF